MLTGEPWSTLVVAPGESNRHGLDPRDTTRTLCGGLEVTDGSEANPGGTVVRGVRCRSPFLGTSDGDCASCAAKLSDNHR